MTATSMFANVTDRLFRVTALRHARAAMLAPGDPREAALRQARLTLEVARRVAEPVERLPAGPTAPVLTSLYRDAVYWALLAGRATAEPDGAPDLKQLWADLPPEAFPASVRDDATLELVRRKLVESSGPDRLSATDEDVARIRRFAEALVADLDVPRRRVGQLLGIRWAAIGGVAVVVLLIVFGVRTLVIGRNLVADRPPKTSTSWAGCSSDPGCVPLLFCTDDQADPWAEFDLGSAKPIHRVDVTNRDDCCGDRAVPLVIETSNDRVSWAELGRRNEEFTSFTLKFAPRVTRYVRFRVPKRTVFHLKDVAIR
jgi:hypothetical protein